MNRDTLESPKHSAIRSFLLRRLGPIVAGVGLIFMVVGFGSFFMSTGSFERPHFFWCAFVGMPVLFIGVMMCMFGFMGAMARYQAAEMAPVAKDVVNYMGENTRPGVKAVAKAVTEGIIEAKKQEKGKH
jgi:hypothetical protein